MIKARKVPSPRNSQARFSKPDLLAKRAPESRNPNVNKAKTRLFNTFSKTLIRPEKLINKGKG